MGTAGAVTPEKIVKSKRFVAQLEKLHKAKRLHRIAVDVRSPHRTYDDEGEGPRTSPHVAASASTLALAAVVTVEAVEAC